MHACHDKVPYKPLEKGATRKHRDIEFQHFKGPAPACYTCHNPGDMNTLRLAGSETISIDESYRLCGQCHGEKLRDFNIGAHGKQVGSWLRIRHKLNCTDCHNPHRPAMPTTRALPPPPFPARGIPKGGVH